MEEAGILSYRVVFFEFDEEGTFIGPEGYPSLALVTVGSHDLATLHGWWEGRDIDLKARHGLYPSDDEERHQREQREKERVALIDALVAAGLRRPEDLKATGLFCPELADAVHTFLARTRSGLAMVQLDDLTDETDQVNLPATTDEHPNWRRKQSLGLEELAADARVRTLADILNEARPSAWNRKSPNVC
jgi:4-alpha-glucanotransferase